MKLLLVFVLLLGLYTRPILAQTAQTPEPLRTDWAKLARYTAANKALPPPSASTPRVVLLGNSITDAWPSADPQFFAGKPYEFVGRGISGQTSPQMLLRFRQDVLELQPRVVAILAGTNDVAENTGPYDPHATLNNIKSMVDLALASKVRVVLCSVLPAAEFGWRKGLNPASKIVALNAMIKEYAQQNKLVYLDYHTPMANEQMGLKAAYGEDGVHPNLTGYRVMEPLLQEAVTEALRRK